jgi:hypothetical protein
MCKREYPLFFFDHDARQLGSAACHEIPDETLEKYHRGLLNIFSFLSEQNRYEVVMRFTDK